MTTIGLSTSVLTHEFSTSYKDGGAVQPTSGEGEPEAGALCQGGLHGAVRDCPGPAWL